LGRYKYKNSLSKFDYKIIENDNKWRLSGERQDKDLWCSIRKVLTKSEKDEKEIVGLSSMVVTKTIPFSGEALMIFGLLGGNNNNEGETQIPFGSFDITLEELPLVLSQEAQGIKSREIRVLDTTELKITLLKLEESKPQTLVIAGQIFKCRVFNGVTAEGKYTYWLAEDKIGAFFVKELGKDSDGSYKIILK